MKVVDLFLSNGIDLNRSHADNRKVGFKGGFVGYSYETYPIFDMMNKAGLADPLTIREKGKNKKKDFDASTIEAMLKGNIDPNLVHHYNWCEARGNDWSLGTEPPTDFSIRLERESLLQRAIKCSHVGIVKILLEKGAKPNEPMCVYVSEGEQTEVSTLDLALTVSKNQEVIELLISHGAVPVTDVPEIDEEMANDMSNIWSVFEKNGDGEVSIKDL